MSINLDLGTATEARLRCVARERGLTEEELVRRCVETVIATQVEPDVSEQPADTAEGVDYLAQYEQALRCTSREELVRRSLEAMGKYTSGHTDLAENHDKHWADATYERLRG